MNQVILILHNVRSTHNVGSLLRTADGLGVAKVFLTGYTPYPVHDRDSRMPHESAKINGKIRKTSLGAENYVSWEHAEDIFPVITSLQSEGFLVASLEQATGSVSLDQFTPTAKMALIVGREVEGIEANILKSSDVVIEIPMRGHKESFNVAVAGAIALYVLTNSRKI